MNWMRASKFAFDDPRTVPVANHSDMLEWWSHCIEGLNNDLEGAEVCVAHFLFVEDEPKMRWWEMRRESITQTLMDAEWRVRRILAADPPAASCSSDDDPFADD